MRKEKLQCYECKKIKPRNEFYVRNLKKYPGRDYRSSYCKVCDKAQSNERYVRYGGNYQKNYYKNNKRKVLLKHLEYRTSWRNKVINHLGGKCVKCGFMDIRALQIDHINGGGRAERKVLNYQTIGLYKKVLEDKENKYQLLCANCNWIKKVEKREVGYGNREKIIYD